jgi:hypothetical protein
MEPYLHSVTSLYGMMFTYEHEEIFTFPVPNITVAEPKGSTLLIPLSRKQNVKMGNNYTETKEG